MDECVFFQAEDGIRDLVRSRGLGDVYKRQGGIRVHTGIGNQQGQLGVKMPDEHQRHLQRPLTLSLIHI